MYLIIDHMIQYVSPVRSNRGGEGSFDETLTSSPPHLNHLIIMIRIMMRITMTMNMMMMMVMMKTWSPSPMFPAVFPRLPPPAVFKKSNSYSCKCFQQHSGCLRTSCFFTNPSIFYWSRTIVSS